MELVKLEKFNGNGYVVSSRVIAKGMKKRHKDVLESIDSILLKGVAEISADLKKIIIPSTYIYFQNKQEYREYLLTKDGFILYMFHIQGHTKFKLDYINEFNRMEKMLREQEKQISDNAAMIPLSKAHYWAKIKELADSAESIRKDAYEKMKELSKMVVNFTDNVDKLSDIAFEVEELINKIEN